MKKILLTAVVLTINTLLFAQGGRNDQHHKQAPAPVQQSFQRDNPNAGNVSWQQGNGQWHARHTDPSSHHSVDTYYDRNGNHLATHREMDRKDVPKDLSQRIDQRYHARGNYNVTKIERPDQHEVYKLKITNKGRNRTVYTDGHGNEINYRERY